MNLKELEQKYEELRKEIERLKEKKEDKLHIEINYEYNCLFFMYKNNRLGYISEKGQCCILTSEIMVEDYEKWRADCMPIDTETVVEWRGGKYSLTEDYELQRIDIEIGIIYDFDSCLPQLRCEDPNIIRFKHNNRPIIF